MSSTRKTTLVLAEELELVREGLAALLEAKGRFLVVGRCGDGEIALRLLRSKQPDVALLDLNLPRFQTLELVSRIRGEIPSVRIVVLGTRKDRKSVLEALRMGAHAFVLKSGSVRNLFEALDQVSRGWVYITRDVARIVAAPNRLDPDDPLSPLSTREYQVFLMLVNGLRPKEIAAQLSLSPKTVDTHRSSLMKKLDVHDVATLVKFAVRRNLTPAV